MEPRKHRILVVEDDEAILMAVEENLKYAGYDVLKAANGPDGLKQGTEGQPDLIILDIMLPGMSGFDVCRKLRDGGVGVPIVMLTARQEEFDKLHGFELGADDYVTKPFSVNELLARVKAILLRGRRNAEGPQQFTFGPFVIDRDARTLKKTKTGRGKGGKGKEVSEETEDIPLTRTEFDLLAYFCANEGKALSRDKVMNEVWGTQYFGTQRSLDSFVASLRAKIEELPAEPRHILTVHGVGYKFVR